MTLQVFQGRLSVNFVKINMMRIDSLLSRYFTEATFQKWGDFLEARSLRQECVSFQTLGRDSSHVKTATNYGGSVKALMKGGDLLIESCGCALFLKIKQHVLCTRIPHGTRTQGALRLLPLKHRCLLHTLFRALTLFLEDVNMKCYLMVMVNHGLPLRAKTLFLCGLFFFEKLEILWI